MKKLLVLTLSLLSGFDAFAANQRNAIAAFDNITIPVMANVAGLQGAFFKTKVSILNPTQLSYPIEVTLYNTGGQVGKTTINMAAGQIRNYDNFLQTIFSYTGAGAVKFDSSSGAPGGATSRDFIVSAEVYTESAGGRYKTVVTPGQLIENVVPDIDHFCLGITVDSSSRVNIGFFNNSEVQNEINADVYNSTGQLVTTITQTLSAKTWNQVPVPASVIGGFIKWRVQSSAYCYAVVVDNTSNDGTFIPASDFIP